MLRTLQAPQAEAKRCCTRWLFVVLILFGLPLMSVSLQALAQSDEDIWTTPVNLSHSGAGSSPAIVVEPDGSLRIFWWDQFDGLMVADGTVSSPALSKVEGPASGSEDWSAPEPAPIFLVETVTVTVESEPPESETVVEEEFIFTPIETMPRMVADAAGRVHAFWLGEPNEPEEPDEPDEETGTRPLMHSRLAAGGTSWSWAGLVTRSAASFDVAADAAGALHLVYVRAVHTRSSPAGLYYRRSDDGGATWSLPRAIHQSRYFRLFSAEDASGDAHVRLAADDAGGVYVTWDDPRLEQVLLAHSADGGMTWQTSGPIGDADGRSQQGEIMAVPGGGALLLWEDTHIGETCGLYQASTSELLNGTVDAGQWVLKELTACPENRRFLPLGEGQVLMVGGIGSDVLTLAAWNGERWSEPRQLSFRFQDPELGRQAYLSDLQVSLVQPPSGDEDEQTAEMLVAVGTDENNEVWITGSQVEALEPIFAPLPPPPTPTPRLRLPESLEDRLEAGPPRPVNLSRSGAASSTTIVTGPDGALRVFWWDQFDGLMVADGAVLALSVLTGTQEISTTLEMWSDPAPAPIFLVETTENGTLEDEFVLTPIETEIDTMPRIVADADGRAHAFWLGEADEETGARRLMHSTLDADSIFWSGAGVVAESAISFDVATDASGALHLAYLCARPTPDSPAGLYYRRSDDGGAIWDAPTAIRQSRYFRQLTSEAAHLRLATDDDGGVYVAWDDPRLGRASFAHSAGGGGAWQALGPVGDPDGQPRRGRVIAVPGGEVWLLWEDASAGGRCNLYQVTAGELLAGAGGAGQRALEGLTACPEPENELFLPLGQGQVLMVAGGGGDTLTLAACDRGQWSEPQRLSFRFDDPELGGQVYLSDLQVALVQGSPDGEGLAGQALLAVGTDQEGDVWVTTSQMGLLEMVFAPPSPWSAPLNFSQGQALPGLPAVAAGVEGRVHVLWSEAPTPGRAETALFYARWDGEGWSRPARVLGSPEGGAEEPSLVAVGDHLHAVWSGGPNGEIFYSRAFLRDAYAAGGWSEPQPLPAPAAVGSWPDVAAGPDGALHVVYAVPLNEGRGIYYTRSDDEGESWSPAQQVFDAAGAGWAMADYPRLAVDARGGLHVAWVRAALPGGGGAPPPQGIYYARSTDWGETWSEPLEAAEGDYAWPQVATSAPDQVHLLWNETTGGRAWWHGWSANGGEGWTRPERVRGFGNVPGPAGLASDGAGTLHLTGLGHDDAGELALLYVTWDGDRWGERESFRLELDDGEPGVAAALLPALGRLDVVLRGEAGGEDGTPQAELWYTGRAVPAVAVPPAPTLLPRPTATPLPTPTPAATPQPTPDFSRAPPPAAGGSMDITLPLLLGGGLAALIVVGVFGTRWLWAGRR